MHAVVLVGEWFGLCVSLKIPPLREAMMGLRKHLRNSHLYEPVWVGDDWDGDMSRHCIKPRLEQPNEWGFRLIEK